MYNKKILFCLNRPIRTADNLHCKGVFFLVHSYTVDPICIYNIVLRLDILYHRCVYVISCLLGTMVNNVAVK
jgi:hypothetical protein